METKTLLILASLGVAYAGIGTLSPQEEMEALQLFERLCNTGGGYGGGYGGGGGGGGGEQGQDIGGTLVYCKRSNDDRQESLSHNVNVQDNTRQQAQVVFVQPPPIKYQHKVLVQGSGSQGQQTKVYVLPQKVSHEVNANYQGQQAVPQKPTVYFLKGDSNSNSNGYGPPQQPSYGPPPQQSQSYGPPQQAPPPQQNYGPPKNGYNG